MEKDVGDDVFLSIFLKKYIREMQEIQSGIINATPVHFNSPKSVTKNPLRMTDLSIYAVEHSNSLCFHFSMFDSLLGEKIKSSDPFFAFPFQRGRCTHTPSIPNTSVLNNNNCIPPHLSYFPIRFRCRYEKSAKKVGARFLWGNKEKFLLALLPILCLLFSVEIRKPLIS